jgi:hypothetical protein
VAAKLDGETVSQFNYSQPGGKFPKIYSLLGRLYDYNLNEVDLVDNLYEKKA